MDPAPHLGSSPQKVEGDNLSFNSGIANTPAKWINKQTNKQNIIIHNLQTKFIRRLSNMIKAPWMNKNTKMIYFLKVENGLMLH